MNAILLHGKPGKDEYYDPQMPTASNNWWLPWLQKQLQVKGIYTQTPEMPDAWNPQYPTWQKEFERYDITPSTIVVGHSCGGGFILRWLSEHPEARVGKVVLVAPSLGLDWSDRSFFDFTLDPDVASRTASLTMFGSNNDRPAMLEGFEQLRQTLKGITYKEFTGAGHFIDRTEFPELRDELIQ